MCQCDCTYQCECHEASFRSASQGRSSRGSLQASLHVSWRGFSRVISEESLLNVDVSDNMSV